MKKDFEAPTCEVIEFENEDILTTSVPTTPEYPVEQ